MEVTTILGEKKLAFTDDSAFGLYTCWPEELLFTLEDGARYTVVWDGAEHTFTASAMNMNGQNGVCVGNLSILGLGDDTKEPFLFGILTDMQTNIFFSTEEKNSHTVAIYQGVKEEAPEGIVLKDRSGKDVAYYGIETVTFDTTTEGVQATYVSERLIRAQQQADWAQTEETAVDFIKNKPAIPEAYTHPESHDVSMITGLAGVATSGSYNDLSDTPDLSGIGAQVQPDWAQTDPREPDYIKNKPFGPAEDIFPEAVVPFTVVQNGVYQDDGSYVANAYCTDGKTYIVVWDGKEYECVAKAIAYTSGSLGNERLCRNYVGGASAGTGTDSKEPFCIRGANTCYANTGGEHTFRVYEKNAAPVRLDARYLPDAVKLPAVTAADNGKVLKVVDGVWTVASI